MPGTKPIVVIYYGAESKEGQSDIRNKAQTGLAKAQKNDCDQLLSGKEHTVEIILRWASCQELKSIMTIFYQA